MDSSKLLTCAEFCILRDQFQRERQAAALPILRAQQIELQRRMKALVAKRGERVNIGLEEDIKQLGFELQYIWSQMAMIEGEHHAD